MFARTMIIETPTCEIETPVLFPVHNAGARGRGNSPEYWKEIPDIQNMMLNANFLTLTGYFPKIKEKGVHKYFGLKGAVFIDSGGFQNRLYNLKLKPLDMLKIQEELGADIGATLDIPIFPKDNIFGTNHSQMIRVNVENALIAFRKKKTDMLMFASVHGNESTTIVNTIDHLMKKGDFDGFALGGLVLKRSNYKQLINLVLATRKRIKNKLLHIFGLGGPSFIPLLVYLGADSFDSSSFLKAGARRIYFLPTKGSVAFKKLPNLEYLPCVCPICSKLKPSDVRAQRKLIALHNLWSIAYEIRTVKLRIKENTFEEYLETRFVDNPIMKMMFKYAKMKVRGLI